MRVSAVLFLGMGIACAADRCSPPPELASFIGALPVNDNRALREAIEERLKQTPGEFTLHRMFVDASVYEKKPVRDRYQRLLESHTDSLDYQYLQARTLVGSNTKQALQIYARILEKDPDYPWVHFSQLEIYRSEAFRDRAKLASSFSAIQRVCPSLYQPYSYLSEIPDDATAVLAAKKLRELLKEAKTPAELRLYSALWAVEFRIRPAAEYDDERKLVAEDLKRLVAFESEPRIRAAIENGAKIIGDTALEQRMARDRKPDPNRALMTQVNAWLKEHPHPKTGDSSETRHAYGKDLLAKSDEWRKMAPDQVLGPINRVEALILLDAPPDEIGQAGDDLLALVRRMNPAVSSWIISLARKYLDAGVLLGRIDPLCMEAMSRLDDAEAVIEIDLAPRSDMTARHRQQLVNDHMDAMLVQTLLYEKQGNPDKAHAKLWEASDYFEANAPTSGGPEPMVLDTRAIGKFSLLRTKAEMAEREGRKLDALIGYRDALVARNMLRNDLTARQRKLWKELGGSEEGWQQWTTPLASDSASSKAQVPLRSPGGSSENRKLPPLAVKDIEGNNWTLERFTGKTVIATVWATWCDPCRAELPYFVKLVERLKGREDVLAISFNADANIAIAQAFAKSQGYTFPVIAAMRYVEDLMPEFSIPRTWIIRDGTIAKEYYGFGPDGDKWIEQILADFPK